jgi:hypothetical protein
VTDALPPRISLTQYGKVAAGAAPEPKPVFPPVVVRFDWNTELDGTQNNVDTSIELAFVLSRIITPARARVAVLPLQLTTRATIEQSPVAGTYKNRKASAFVLIPVPPPLTV